MSSITFKEAQAVFEALAERADQPTDLWSIGQRHEWLELVETLGRILPALQHDHINQLAAYAAPEELGGPLRVVLADRLRITRGEATRRIAEAADLAPRRALTGEPLPPRLEATAAGQQTGQIGAEHVRIIRAFFAQLPCFVDEPAKEQAERDLAEVASHYRPDELRRFAAHLESVLNPDGNFSDEDRARRRGITLGPQGPDGMSRIAGWVNPELRAGLDAVFAKWAAPGMCNPADDAATIAGAPPHEAINTDTRTTAQRNHDALGAMVRSTLMSGELGTHQGLPVTIVATATLADLQAKTGVAHTAGGTVLPMTDLIRMAARAYNYLLIFDNAKRCELYRGRDTRLATPAQRLVLAATERGCTRPGCDVPAYWCHVHHVTDWARGGPTNIDNLTLACGTDNRLATDTGWTTVKKDGTTEWIPPPDQDRGQPRTNGYHHPERYLRRDDEDEPDT